MGIAKKYIEKKATQRIPAPVLDAAGKALIEGIDRAVESRWERAQETARLTPGASAHHKARAIASPIRRSMTALGAAAGATAAAPGVGTSVAMGTLVAELGVVALKTTDMVMSIGRFKSGETDLRGVFVADGLRGKATVIAKAGEARYAFHRGERWLGARRQVRHRGAKNQAPVDYDGYLRKQNQNMQEQSQKGWDQKRRRARRGVQVQEAR